MKPALTAILFLVALVLFPAAGAVVGFIMWLYLVVLAYAEHTRRY
jgi:hypothetical protein